MRLWGVAVLKLPGQEPVVRRFRGRSLLWPWALGRWLFSPAEVATEDQVIPRLARLRSLTGFAVTAWMTLPYQGFTNLFTSTVTDAFATIMIAAFATLVVFVGAVFLYAQDERWRYCTRAMRSISRILAAVIIFGLPVTSLLESIGRYDLGPWAIALITAGAWFCVLMLSSMWYICLNTFCLSDCSPILGPPTTAFTVTAAAIYRIVTISNQVPGNISVFLIAGGYLTAITLCVIEFSVVARPSELVMTSGSSAIRVAWSALAVVVVLVGITTFVSYPTLHPNPARAISQPHTSFIESDFVILEQGQRYRLDQAQPDIPLDPASPIIPTFTVTNAGLQFGADTRVDSHSSSAAGEQCRTVPDSYTTVGRLVPWNELAVGEELCVRVQHIHRTDCSLFVEPPRDRKFQVNIACWSP